MRRESQEYIIPNESDPSNKSNGDILMSPHPLMSPHQLMSPQTQGPP